MMPLLSFIDFQVEEKMISLKNWGLSFLPECIQPLFNAIILVCIVVAIVSCFYAVATVFERKGLGRMQNRPGPHRIGLWGFLQPIADGLKIFLKEDIVPKKADKVVFFLAPGVMIASLFCTFAVIPYGRGMTPVELDGALLFFFAASAGSEVGSFMAGWSSHNKYSLLGGMRAIAQMISFELPLILSTVTVVMIAGTLSLTAIVEAQSGYWHGIIPKWYIFTPWGFFAFLLFIVAGSAEMNRAPFDLAEGDSELIAGFMIEYSGFRYAMIYMAEYFGIFATCALGTTLFLGGYHPPLGCLSFIPTFVWFFIKLHLLFFCIIWSRATFPRLRADQLMNFCWKFLFPLSIVNIVVTIIWHFAGNDGGSSLLIKWGVCPLLIIGCYYGLASLMYKDAHIAPRTYTYAER